MKSAKPLPATFKANQIEDSSPLIHLDIERCRAAILKHSEWEWCIACAADELVTCNVENCYSLDFVFVEGRELKTASKWVSHLPFQNSGFYHQSAVRFMLRFGICTFENCKVGFRCTGIYKNFSKNRWRESEAAFLRAQEKQRLTNMSVLFRLKRQSATL